jgi:signal transduction histidine kinase
MLWEAKQDIHHFIKIEQIQELDEFRQNVRDKIKRFHVDIHFAWYVRQVDGVKAIDIVSDFFSSANESEFPSLADYHLLCARALLIKAELSRLFIDLCLAKEYCHQALMLFERYGNAIGKGDAWQCLAELSLVGGAKEDAYNLLENAAASYKSAGAQLHYEICIARIALERHYENVNGVSENSVDKLIDVKSSSSDLSGMYWRVFDGVSEFQFGNFPDAIKFLSEALDISLQYGAIMNAIQICMSIGAAYANLYDLPAAMEWKEKAYDMAKKTKWPMAIGTTLASMGETTISLKQYEKAHIYFQEAIPYIEKLSNTRRHAIAYNAYGELFLETGKPDMALVQFEKALAVADVINQIDVRISGLIGYALALHQMGEDDRAVISINQAVEFSTESKYTYHLIKSLKVLAKIQRNIFQNDVSVAISTLEVAIGLGAGLKQFTLQSDILTELARDYEAIGDYQKALHYERRARDSWQRNFDQQNGARILAMQVRFDTARAKAEAEHHRELAKSEAQRAATLDEANQILERLGQVGQEITARLDYEGVFQTIYGHIKELMPADFLSIGLVDEDRQIIDVRYRVEDEVRLPPREVALEADSLVAQCVREGRELLSRTDDGRPPILVPGTRPMNTVLVRPLAVGGRRLGVISVQSEQVDAYGDRERRIFSTLCAYSAIALSNAETYDQLGRAVADLREALHRLVQQEKMAALGQLVAGVAHEVNTPLGVTLSAVSLLHDNIRNLQETLGNGGLTRSTLTEHLQTGLELSSLAQRNVVRASDMIRSFKEVAVDRGSDDRRVFDLGDYLREIANLMKAKLTGKGSQVELDVGLIQMDTYPGALAQTITNLLANVADHAYGPEEAGPVRLSARQIDGDMVEITVSDEGRGLDQEVLEQAFDPFFTTNRAAGHMGLGLHVAYNQVTQRLAGRISLANRHGGGAEAVICIPRELPTFSRPGLSGRNPSEPLSAIE